VLDPRPFRVAAVEYSPLTAAATSESNQIAVWNAAGEGGLSWRIRDDGETVRMVLPPEFESFGELSVGSRLAPFSINVWILNGGGYLTQRLSFLPAARPRAVLTYVLDIAIVAGVGLGFSFGIVSGGENRNDRKCWSVEWRA
jgi:hypothetical protein